MLPDILIKDSELVKCGIDPGGDHYFYCRGQNGKLIDYGKRNIGEALPEADIYIIECPESQGQARAWKGVYTTGISTGRYIERVMVRPETLAVIAPTANAIRRQIGLGALAKGDKADPHIKFHLRALGYPVDDHGLTNDGLRDACNAMRFNLDRQAKDPRVAKQAEENWENYRVRK